MVDPHRLVLDAGSIGPGHQVFGQRLAGVGECPLDVTRADSGLYRVPDLSGEPVRRVDVQGTLGGLMFWWLGLPEPLLWGVIMGLLAVVPVETPPDAGGRHQLEEFLPVRSQPPKNACAVSSGAFQ